mgnify:CR=1 FL=1
MARLESTSLSVSPSMEQETIEIHQKFGWELKSSQEIFNKDSHNEVRGDYVYNVSETTNYVKLVFQRDKDMPYYNEICEIETKYYNTLNSKPLNSYSGVLMVIGIIITLLGVFFLLSRSLWPIPIIALGIFIIIMRIKVKKGKKAEYDEKISQWENELTMLLAEVENYI